MFLSALASVLHVDVSVSFVWVVGILICVAIVMFLVIAWAEFYLVPTHAVVFYHAYSSSVQCSDGMLAKILFQRLHPKRYTLHTVDYHPWMHGENALSDDAVLALLPKRCLVVFLDCAPRTRALAEKISAVSVLRRMVIIDHHASLRTVVVNADEGFDDLYETVVFSEHQCAAELVCKHFGAPVPALARLVSASDRRDFTLRSREAVYGLANLVKNPEVQFPGMLPLPTDAGDDFDAKVLPLMIESGHAMVKRIERYMETHVRASRFCHPRVLVLPFEKTGTRGEEKEEKEETRVEVVYVKFNALPNASQSKSQSRASPDSGPGNETEMEMEMEKPTPAMFAEYMYTHIRPGCVVAVDFSPHVKKASAAGREGEGEGKGAEMSRFTFFCPNERTEKPTMAEIAQHFGGGGHAACAGCSIPTQMVAKVFKKMH